MKRRINSAYLFVIIVFLVIFFFPDGSSGQRKGLEGSEEIATKSGLITMNFKDVDIGVFIKFISELTGKNFLVDPAVKGNITVLSPEKVTMDEAYKVFLSVLDVHGYSTVPTGKIIKIVPAAEARTKGVESRFLKESGRGGDNIVTQLVPLQYGDVTEFSRLMKPLVAKTGLLIPYSETNTLIIIDAMSNIDRLLRIVRELDIPGSKENIRVFTLENASAKSLDPVLSELFITKGRQKPTLTDVKIVSDERTNSLIIVAAPQVLEDMGRILKELDREQVRPRGNIHLYSLQNAVAEDVAKVLGEIPGKGEQDKQKGKGPPLSKDVQISADKATNTLVIVAEPEEFQILEDIIKKLDRRRAMVYVEALIIEVATGKALDLGVEWRVGDEYKGGLAEGTGGGVWLGGSTGLDSGLGTVKSGNLPTGFSAGVIGRGITLGDTLFPSIGAFVRAVRTDSDFNVISTPQLLTLDNEEASIEVGQNIPFVTRVDQGTSEIDRAIQSFEYKDVGVNLKVTPQINDNRYVRLNLEQSVKDVIQTTTSGGFLAPTTTFRTTKTSIAIKDGETAVIGGLIDKKMSRVKTQTPCLGGLPVLGWAFKQVGDEDSKTNLLVFLTPHIIENPEEGRELYGKKKAYIDEEVEKNTELIIPELLRRKAFE
ncbi:MAG: type II secretion system secretin GspD [Desulfatiglandales bacterium]